MRVAFATVVALLALSTSAFADVRVVVSKSQQQMAVSIDGGPSYRWAVSTGRSGYTTPSGNFRAIRLEQVYYSKKYDNAPMPHAVFFYGGYAIHGTLEERHLGRAVSHGCVRLTRANAAILFDAVRQAGMNHTHIVITDAPLYGGMPVAREFEPPADALRYREATGQIPRYQREAVTMDPRYRERRADIPGYTTFDDAPRSYYYVEGPVRSEPRPPRTVVVRDPSYVDLTPRGRVAPRHLTRQEQRDLAREAARREAQVRRHMRLEPGRVYTEAELKRFYRENGLEW